MPIILLAEKGAMEGKKKKGFLDYGKDEDEPKKDDEGEDEEESESDAVEMRTMHLAEQTGVDDPKALVKLIKHCMKQE